MTLTLLPRAGAAEAFPDSLEPVLVGDDYGEENVEEERVVEEEQLLQEAHALAACAERKSTSRGIVPPHASSRASGGSIALSAARATGIYRPVQRPGNEPQRVAALA